eukprot:INCI3180.1.p1 GENE.INCI3180.1~~INCI3180.1.p1  ORF type:complete len:579 (-),score=115.44 INCI3180.1:537-2273(-)
MKLLSALFVGALSASGAQAKRVTMEPDVLVSKSYRNWEATEVADKASTTMDVLFFMKHDPADVQKLEDTLYAVSDPKSPSYGDHLSLDQLKELTPIPSSALKAVTAFLGEGGVDDTAVRTNHNEDIVTATVTLEQAEYLFDTTISKFTPKGDTGRPVELFRASGQYSLPEEVASVVSFVGDLVRVPAISTVIRVNQKDVAAVKAGDEWPNSCPGLGAACKTGVNPAVLNQRYNITQSFNTYAEGNSFAVAEFQGQYYNPKDLVKFSEGCGVNVTVDNVVGKDLPESGVEALLDVEYIAALSDDIPLTFYYQAEYSLLKWAEGLSNDETAPLVHSVSYGNDEKQQTSGEYIFSVATQFMKLGARGLSILFASGDQGVCGRSGCGLIKHHFNPDFPAACPYVTAVGGTDFLERSVIGDEKAWTDGGGGFSDHFDIPTWQADAVSKYKADPSANLPPQQMWNNTGRGYPDVAALGGQENPYCVLVNGVTEGVAGTSASCPVTASIFAKLNGIRLAAGKPALGFLNPFIYQNEQAFNDVKDGKNTGGGLGGYGFQAIPGWDPATGMGTPNFGLLAEAVQALP